MFDALEREGFALARGLFDLYAVESIKAACCSDEVARSERRGELFGARNLFALTEVREAADRLRAALPEIGNWLAVRSLFFDKTPGANWPVPWHQDLTIAVRDRQDLSGWTNWTTKRGILHVQPRASLLARMITARVHLDDCEENNGPLRAIASSHTGGVLPRSVIDGLRQKPAQIITAASGDVLLMKPLLLHASSPARAPSHRRVLHIEFAPNDLLPAELTWAGAH